MNSMVLKFRPISELPPNIVDGFVVRGGCEDSGFKTRPYFIHSVWCDKGRFFVGRAREVEIVGPKEFALIPQEDG